MGDYFKKGMLHFGRTLFWIDARSHDMCSSSKLISSCRKIALVQATLEASSPVDLRSEREDVTWRVISEAVRFRFRFITIYISTIIGTGHKLGTSTYCDYVMME